MSKRFATRQPLWIILLFLLLPASTGWLQAQQKPLEKQLDLLELHGFSGSILIENSKGLKIARGLGWANASTRLKATPETLYPVASITKHFTATAILLLVQESRLQLEDRVERFWPDRFGRLGEAAVGQLIAHRSGLPFDCAETEPPSTREQFLTCLESVRMVDAPGQRHEYSNAGYALLAAVIEEVSGQSYSAFVRSRLLEPAGMTETGFLDEVDRWPSERIAHQYTWSRDFETEVQSPIDWNFRGSADLVSNVVELARWPAYLARILNPEARSRLKDLASDGWSSADGSERGCLGGTMTLGYNAVWCGDSASQVIVLSNQNYGLIMPAGRVVELVEHVLAGRKSPLDWTPSPGAIPDLSSWVGSYRLEGESRLEVRSEGDVLVLSGRGQRALNLLLVTDPAKQKVLEGLTDITQRLAKALETGDFSGASRFSGGAQSAEVLETWLRGLEKRLGSVQGIEVIGTIPQNGDARTYIELRFERGRETRRLRWIDDRLTSILSATLPVAPVRFVPVGSKRLIGFHLGYVERGPVELRLDPAGRTISIGPHRFSRLP